MQKLGFLISFFFSFQKTQNFSSDKRRTTNRGHLFPDVPHARFHRDCFLCPVD